MWYYHVITAWILITAVAVSYGINSYMLVFPKTIRPGLEMDFQLTLLTKFPELELSVWIKDGRKTVADNHLTVARGASGKTFSMKLPKALPSGDYSLEVEAKDPRANVHIDNSTALEYEAKSISVFIQTDKAIYKPGQKVQFRAFAVRPDLSIIKSTMDIEIFDNANNKIAQWLKVSGRGGVFQDELQLSNRPPLGDWRIAVHIRGTSKEKIFTVAEYVLPKFEVTISIPGYSFGLTTDKYLAGMISTKYTFGKGVEGSGTLTVSKKYNRRASPYHLNFQTDGEYKFQISMSDLTKQFGEMRNYDRLELKAIVKEGVTGKTMEDTTEHRYFNMREKLVFLQGSDTFKPGLRYTGNLYLSDQDDKPLGQSAILSLTITMYHRSGDGSDTQTSRKPGLMEDEPMILPRRLPPFIEPPMESIVDGPKSIEVSTNGMATFTLDAPKHIERIYLQAEYRISENQKNPDLTASKNIQKFHSTSNNYVQALLKTGQPTAGKSAVFEIRTTVNDRPKVSYLVISKGMVVKTGTLRMKRTGIRSLSIRMKSNMAPSTRLVVHFVRKDGEVLADSIQFTVEGIFNNEVDISYSRDEAQPGSQVSITVKAHPGSQCSVLTVDKSVLLLKSGNDITPTMVEDELESYDVNRQSPCGGRGDFCIMPFFFPFPTPGNDVTDTFKKSGLAVVTDAFLYDYKPPRPRFLPMMRMDDGVMMEAMADGPVMKDASVGGAAAPRVRTKFPETWIFDTTRASRSGRCVINATVPDTITSWVASAFAVHGRKGLGVAPATASLNVFLNFFVRLDLPYSVVRGEQVVLQAIIFNYRKSPLKVTLLLKKSISFKVVLVKRTNGRRSTLFYTNQDVIRTITVPSGGVIPVSLPIVPVDLGFINIELQVTSSQAGDAVKRQLLVKAEGIEESYNLPVLIDLRNTRSFRSIEQVTFPDNVVEGSKAIRVSAIGDLMGPSIDGLSNLLRMPYGCGEQNMLTLVPNIFVLQYLTATNNRNKDLQNKAKGNMLAGYQRELTYQHHDGSFSAFGNNDPSGSTWLTAFVVKSFSQAKGHIYIDPKLMARVIDWLADQYTNGTFQEPGRVIHKEMQGGSAKGKINLLAYVVIALQEAERAELSGPTKVVMAGIIPGAVAALEKAVPEMEDMYELAITSYALALAGSKDPLKLTIEKLNNLATEKDGMKYWGEEQKSESNNNNNLRWIPPYHQARSLNIETTAYVLLTYAERKDVTGGLPILKWLTRQRNPTGGFGSTQDTVVALQALSNMAALIKKTRRFRINIDVSGTPSDFSHIFKINKRNSLIMQAVDVPSRAMIDNLPLQPSLYKVNAQGRGIALVQIAVSYNVMEDSADPLFSLRISFSDETLNGFKLRVCFSWLGTNTSGMAVMEIGLLSGFEADKFSVTDLGILQRKDDDDNKLSLYFDQISNERACIDVRMQRSGLVAGSQPAVIKLYDYYEPKNHVMGLYQPKLLKESSVCDILNADQFKC